MLTHHNPTPHNPTPVIAKITSRPQRLAQPHRPAQSQRVAHAADKRPYPGFSQPQLARLVGEMIG